MARLLSLPLSLPLLSVEIEQRGIKSKERGQGRQSMALFPVREFLQTEAWPVMSRDAFFLFVGLQECIAAPLNLTTVYLSDVVYSK